MFPADAATLSILSRANLSCPLCSARSDVHSAVGCNMFRMITGRKKWWLIPPSQTPYVRPALNPNGFSAHTLTKVGKEDGGVPTDNMEKLERYTVVLEPGDVLLNPAWFW